MTTPDQLDALAAAATPGPWSVEGGYVKAGVAALTTVADARYKNGTADRDFIVALVNAYRDGELVAVRERDELRDRLAVEVAEWRRLQRQTTGEKDADEGYAAGLGHAIFVIEELLARAALHREDVT